ncbi:hypothetical protein RXV86_16090 [Alisedimentitalea sp. MJ-SS2]|uniref:hypothetical protein n=1 Tax=Aliisedimentitalea sp. MJ-SS2 TaxID=3049795 RepID=UPI0029064CEE|nr:hypothetical protein [Alisedimentitalea sp. MJ-SS2]MDU8928914.1 hypothetical protein [Alisedimentitalea sp. MJ-SS2]
MAHFEYKIVPAPRKGQKGKGIKGAEARFAYAIQTLMNEMAAEGWEFQRAETLPSDERHGLKASKTVYRDLLVFRRARAEEEEPVNPAPVVSEDIAEDDEAELEMPDDEAAYAAETPDEHWQEHAEDHVAEDDYRRD